MPKQFRLFLASPGDVPSERKVMEKVVAEINQTHGVPFDYRLELVRWQTHAAPAAGRPQQVINEMVGDYDIFVGVMWRRFGTPSAGFGSGTEEEFRIAYGAWEQRQSMPLMFYFCQQPFMPRETDELEQMRKVLLFRKELSGKMLVWDYPSHAKFSDEIRKHLCLRINRLIEDEGAPASRSRPDPETVGVLKQLWPAMSPELREALSVAYNENRRAGDGGIKTQDLFAAFHRLRPKSLEPILEEITPAALPEPTGGPVTAEPYILEELPWLSPCVASSIKRLSKHLPPGRVLTAEDVFADIAKHGTGASVALLRKHNIGPAEIDQIVRQKNIQVLHAPK